MLSAQCSLYNQVQFLLPLYPPLSPPLLTDAPHIHKFAINSFQKLPGRNFQDADDRRLPSWPPSDFFAYWLFYFYFLERWKLQLHFLLCLVVSSRVGHSG
jgi:hypothetical protein